MRMHIVDVMLLLSAVIAAEAVSYSFVSKAERAIGRAGELRVLPILDHTSEDDIQVIHRFYADRR